MTMTYADLTKRLKDCTQGRHELTELGNYGTGGNIAQSIKWCTICGSFFIDEESDGRLVNKIQRQSSWIYHFYKQGGLL